LSQNGFDASNPAGGEFAPAKWGTSRGQFWPSAPHAGQQPRISSQPFAN